MSPSWFKAILPTALCILLGQGLVIAEIERSVPGDFSLVGTYKLEKRVKIRDGGVLPVAIKPIYYEVYTDGVTVRCYTGSGTVFSAFEIYRRDGISVAKGKGLVERVPGIQARSIAGEVLRQLSLTEQSMTLARFPALSDIVEITYSRRVPGKQQQ